jgi:hypothetical protein
VSYRDELEAWKRTREATKRIMDDAGCDEKGWPLAELDDAEKHAYYVEHDLSDG